MLLQGCMQPVHGCEQGIRPKSPWGNHINCPIGLMGHVSYQTALKVEQVSGITDTPLLLNWRGPLVGGRFPKMRPPNQWQMMNF